MKLLILRVLRRLGVFRLCLFLTRRKLRILCYHGFSSGDEHLYDPFLFMRPEVFAQRMKVLARRRLPIISLDEAVARLSEGTIGKGETVITFDDGWTSNITAALPLLAHHGFPAVVYATTDHLTDNLPVFNVVLAYMLWKARIQEIAISGVHEEIDGIYPLGDKRMQTAIRLMMAKSRLLNREQGNSFLRHVAFVLGLHASELLDTDRFRLMSRVQMQGVLADGFDLQLHTHTHRLPGDTFENAVQEIDLNRRALDDVAGSPRLHFCYPSGLHVPEHPSWLARIGIVSATTCESGFAGERSNPLLLPRFLDRDDADEVLFDAEICGLMEVRRHSARLLRRKSSIPQRLDRQHR